MMAFNDLTTSQYGDDSGSCTPAYDGSEPKTVAKTTIESLSEYYQVPIRTKPEQVVGLVNIKKNIKKIKKNKNREEINDLLSDKNQKKFLSIVRKMEKEKKTKKFFAQGLLNLDINPLSDDFKDGAMDLVKEMSTQISASFKEDLKEMFDLCKITNFVLKMSTIFAMVWLSYKASKVIFSRFVKVISVLVWNEYPVMEMFNQSGLDAEFIGFEDISPILTCFFGFLSAEKINYKSLMDFALKWNRISVSFSSFAVTIKEILKKSVNTFRCFILGMDPYFSDGTGESKVNSWLNSIRDYYVKSVKKELKFTSSNYSGLQSLLVQGKLLQQTYVNKPRDYDNIRVAIRVGISDVEKLMDAFNKSSFDKTKLRPKPLTILLKGKSGVGKSAVTVPLLDAIMVRTFKNSEELIRYKENNMDFIYSRAAETGFWDGYCGQRAVVMDDFMQVNELQATGNIANEAFDMIRASNVFPHLLHKAHLDDKGNSFFEGRIILCSTNNFRMRSEILIEPEALTRRFDVTVEVYPKEEFCTESTKHGPLTARRLKHLDEFSTDVYEFKLIEKNTARFISYNELVIHCTEMYNAIEEWGEKYLDKVTEMRSKEVENKEDLMAEEEVFFDAHIFEQQGLNLHTLFARTKFLKVLKDLAPFCKQSSLEQSLDLFEGYMGKIPHRFYKSKRFMSVIAGNAIDLESDALNKDLFSLQLRICLLDTSGLTNKEALIANVERHMDNKAFNADLNEAFQHQGMVDAPEYLCINHSASDLSLELERHHKELKERNSVIGVIKRRYEDLKIHCQESFRFLSEKVSEFDMKRPWLKWVLMIGSLVICAQALYSAFSPAVNDHQGYVKIQAGKTPRGKKKSSRRMPKSLHNMNLFYEQQADANVQSIEVLHKVTTNNSYVVTLKALDKKLGTVLAVKKGVFMMNAHFHDDVSRAKEKLPSEQHELHFCPIASWTNGSHVECFDISFDEFLRVKPTNSMRKMDIWIKDFGTLVRPHKDITKNFVKEASLESYDKNIPTLTYFVSDFGDRKINCVNDLSPLTPITTKSGTYNNTLTYHYPSKNGDCGSICFLNEHSTMGNILGIHSAGNTILGVAATVTREWLEETLQTMNLFESQGLFDVEYFGEDEFITYGSHRAIAKVEKGVHLSRDSKLRKSIVFDCFSDFHEITRLPAQLKVVDGEDPYDNAVDRYATPDMVVNPVVLDEAIIDYFYLLNAIPYADKSLLSFEEACMGIHGEPYINGVNRKSSPGFPWVLNTTLPGKKEFFSDGDEYTFDSKACHALRKRVDLIISKAREGERLLHVYMDTMKDELRSIKKVESLQTRMISCSPLDYTIAFRMYFGRFMDMYIKNRIFNGSAVGINPLSTEWSVLGDYVTSFGNNVIAGDFSSFDATQNSGTLKALLKIINLWYDDGNDNIREILWYEIYNSRHLQDNIIVQWLHCLPSGNPITSIANTMYTNVLIRCVWIDLFGSHSLDKFASNVRYVGFGDDNVMGVSDEVIPSFNYYTITSSMQKFGMAYTNEDKSDSDVLCKTLEECTFLKRGFNLNFCGMYEAPLSIVTILEMPYWYRKGPGVYDRMRENAENALKEVTLYGPVMFEEIREILNLASKEAGQPYNFLHGFAYYKTKLISDWKELSESSDEGNEQIIPYKVGDEKDNADVPIVIVESYYQDDVKNQELQYVNQMGDVINRIQTPAANNNQNSNEQNSNANVEIGLTDKIIGKVSENGSAHHVNTIFEDDAYTREAEPFTINNINAMKDLHQSSMYDKTSIEHFLSTPVRIREFSVTTADTAGTTLSSGTNLSNFICLPFDPNNLNANTVGSGYRMWRDRLNAYMGFRATAILRFTVNVNRFAQGRLLVSFLPGARAGVNANFNTDSHRFNLRTRTQMPRVEINLNKDTSAIMKIPYVSALGMYDLSDFAADDMKRGLMGRVYVSVYSPLVGASSIDFNTFLHFEDIELITPTYSTQSGLRAKEAYEGVVSAPANHISQAAKALSKIPALSTIAKTVEWISTGVAKTAANFGYSKPLNFEAVTRYKPVQNEDSLNVDVPDASAKMSWNRGQNIPVMSGFAGNDLDEMSFEYICNRPSFQGRFSWLASSLAGANLYGLSLSPSTQFDTTVVDSTNVLTCSPFAMVAAQTGLWRADFVVTLKVIKTEFHTGKLAVTFRPGLNLNLATTYDGTAYLPRQIIDIKESDTFVFKVPYAGITPMLDYDSVMGRFNVWVVNELQAAPNASADVDVIVEVAAENVAFSGCSEKCYSMVTGSAIGFIPQSGLTEHTYVLGDMPSRDCSYAPLITTGESISSVKQLIMRKQLNNSWLVAGSTARVYSMRPFVNGGAFKPVGSLLFQAFSGDRLSFWTSCYTLSRGGIRYSAHILESSTSNTLAASLTLRQTSESLPAFATSNTGAVSRTGFINQYVSVHGNLDIEVPQWGAAYARECLVTFDDADLQKAEGESNQLLNIITPRSTQLGGTLRITRNAADDYHLGYFIGVPAVVLCPATVPYSIT